MPNTLSRMPNEPKKDPTSLDEIQQRLQKDLRETDAVKAAIEAVSEKTKELSRKIASANAPEIEDLGKVIAARLLEQQQQKQQDADRLQAAIHWIEDKWGSQPCPYCRQIEWQVGTPAEIALAGGEVMSPSFPVMCGNCGHTTFVNAIRAGLVPEPDEDKE